MPRVLSPPQAKRGDTAVPPASRLQSSETRKSTDREGEKEAFVDPRRQKTITIAAVAFGSAACLLQRLVEARGSRFLEDTCSFRRFL